MISIECKSSKAPAVLLYALLFLLHATGAQGQEVDLNVLDDWLVYSDAEHALYHHLNQQAQQLLADRKAHLDSIRTLEDWQQRQAEIKHILHEIAGPLPDRTPLRPRITGTLERASFRVEKVVYESRPGYFVSAALFIPRSVDAPAPGILFCSGHTSSGFRSEVYQTMILNLVSKGFVVLAFDPIGQGERSVYFNDGEPYPGGPTHQHSYPGAQQFILGQSPAVSMIWDGIRGIDYLVSRPEVDASRIGVTGRSGGGTQSAYIAAFDERVTAAAPEAYVTGYSRLMNSIGPQDAEQNLFHGIRAGIDHGDLLAVRAPRPTLVISTTRDFFSIQGARETYREVQRIYEAYDAEEALSMVEDNANHASTVKNREAMYEFFQQALQVPGSSSEENIPLFSMEDLQVTPGGQVAFLPRSRSIFSLIQEDAETSIGQLAASRKSPTHFSLVRRQAMHWSGYQDLDTLQSPVFTGRYQLEGYDIEKYFIQGEGDYPLPYLLMIPHKPGPHPLLVHLDPAGKPSEGTSLASLERWIHAGYAVLALDLPGMGELGPGTFKGDAFIDDVSYNLWFASILIGRSLTGILAADLNRIVQTVTQHDEVNDNNVAGVAWESLAPVLLHAAAAEPFYKKLVLARPLVSTESLVTKERYNASHIPSMVAGSIWDYDLPDLAGSLAPLEITLIHPLNPDGSQVSQETVEHFWEVSRRRYVELGVPENLQLISSDNDPHMGSLLDTALRTIAGSNSQN